MYVYILQIKLEIFFSSYSTFLSAVHERRIKKTQIFIICSPIYHDDMYRTL